LELRKGKACWAKDMGENMKQEKLLNSSTLFWAGIALAIGSFGVVLASAFYALSPVVAALPAAGMSIEDAYHGMISGRTTMMAAGVIGLPSDVILIAGTLLLTVFRTPPSLQIQRLGLALVAVGVLIFTLVDSLAAGVLTQIAAFDSTMTVFAGFKFLFDILFVFGTLTVGLGMPLVLISELKAASSILAKPFAWAGILFSLVGLAASILYFVQISLPLVIGISISGSSLIFGIYGIQIARRSSSSHKEI
jgi:hypothetical protein